MIKKNKKIKELEKQIKELEKDLKEAINIIEDLNEELIDTEAKINIW